MAQQQPSDSLTIESSGPITVARFSQEVVLTGVEAEGIAERLKSLLSKPDHQRLLLDFANVRSLSSIMLGKLIQLNRIAEAAGGRFALCNLQPDVREIMDVTRLNHVLFIYPTESEAMQGF